MSAVEPSVIPCDVDEGQDAAVVRAAWELEARAAVALGRPDLVPVEDGRRVGDAAASLRTFARREPEERGAAALLRDADRCYWSLVERYDKRVRVQARRLASRSRVDVDDVLTEVRLLWWRAATSWDPDAGASYPSWSWGWARRASRSLATAPNELLPEVEETADPAPVGERLDVVRALASCPMTPRERAVVDALFGFHGEDPLSIQDAAVHLRLGRATVRATRDTVIRRLRRHLGATP